MSTGERKAAMPRLYAAPEAQVWKRFRGGHQDSAADKQRGCEGHARHGGVSRDEAVGRRRRGRGRGRSVPALGRRKPQQVLTVRTLVLLVILLYS